MTDIYRNVFKEKIFLLFPEFIHLSELVSHLKRYIFISKTFFNNKRLYQITYFDSGVALFGMAATSPVTV